MAEHFLLTTACRNFSQHHISQMTDEQVIRFFSQARWGSEDMQACPACGEIANHYWRRSRAQWRCRGCCRDFSVTSGTAFSHRKISLRRILEMIFNFAVSAKGVPAAQLARSHGHRWRTCWLLTAKLREVLLKNRETTLLSGVVQMDGGYFGGKRRDANQHGLRTQAYRDAVAAKVESAPTPRSRRRKQLLPGGVENARRRKNRRVIMVLRELFPEAGSGARRTIVSVARSENDKDAMALAQRFITPGAVVMTDESGAFTQLSHWFDHKTVQHSIEYSTKDGVNDNQAESYFSRIRRAEYGVFHRFTPLYLMDYAQEFVWREDSRRQSMRDKVEVLLRLSLRSGRSAGFGAYYQGNRRALEILNA
ncbi:MAG: IS1595 family transposase [Ramlibacter sp.]|nr:IS1595 family transposase [Ramlibacter sp.]